LPEALEAPLLSAISSDGLCHWSGRRSPSGDTPISKGACQRGPFSNRSQVPSANVVGGVTISREGGHLVRDHPAKVSPQWRWRRPYQELLEGPTPAGADSMSTWNRGHKAETAIGIRTVVAYGVLVTAFKIGPDAAVPIRALRRTVLVGLRVRTRCIRVSSSSG